MILSFSFTVALILLIISLSILYLKLIIPLKSEKSDHLSFIGNIFSETSFKQLSLFFMCLGVHVALFLSAMSFYGGDEGVVATVFAVLLNLLITPIVFVFVYYLCLFSWVLVSKEKNKTDIYCSNVIAGDSHFPSVTVLICCRNEPIDVVSMTVASALAIDYPKDKISVVVCDNSDSGNNEYQNLINYIDNKKEQNENIRLIHRDSIVGYKAGNIDLAIESIETELVLFMDVDSSVPRNILRKHINHFLTDSKLAFMQFFNRPSNQEVSTLANASAWFFAFWKYKEFYRSYFHGWHFFQGHNCLWRCEPLKKILPLAQNLMDEPILVEDAHMTVRINQLGCHGKTVWSHAGFWVPAKLEDLESMLVRWAYGTIQVFVKESRFIRRAGKLRLEPREYTDLIFHLLSQPALVAFQFVLPFMSLSNSGILLLLILWGFLKFFSPLLCFINKKEFRDLLLYDRRGWLHSVFLLPAFNDWCNLKATLEFVCRRRQRWVPTGKDTKAESKCKSDQRGAFLLFRYPLMIYSLFLLGVTCVALYQENIFISLLGLVPCLYQAIGFLLVFLYYGNSNIRYPENILKDCSVEKWGENY